MNEKGFSLIFLYVSHFSPSLNVPVWLLERIIDAAIRDGAKEEEEEEDCFSSSYSSHIELNTQNAFERRRRRGILSVCVSLR